MPFPKDNLHITVTFSDNAEPGSSASPRNLDLVAFDAPTPMQRIAAGEKPLWVWRNHCRASIQTAAHVMGISTSHYEQFERGDYRGLSEEMLAAYGDHFGIHPAALLPVNGPLHEAFLDRLISFMAYVKEDSEAYQFCVYTLRGVIYEGQIALDQMRARGGHFNRLLGPFLDLLEQEFTISDEHAMHPAEVGRMYLASIAERVDALERKSKKPEFVNDSIWRAYLDGILRVYGNGKGEKVTQNLQSLRQLFTGWKNEWAIVCDMVRDEPEILHPVAWQDESYRQMVGGQLLNRDQAVKAMLDNYMGYIDRHIAIERAKREFLDSQADMEAFKKWLPSGEAQSLFAFWRNRQRAQMELGNGRNATVDHERAAQLLAFVPKIA